MPTMVEPVISILSSARDIEDAEWSALSADQGLYAGVPWLRFLEADPSYDVWYVAARAPDGLLLGVMPAYLYAGGPRGGVDRFYDPGVVFAGAEPPAAGAPLPLGGRAGSAPPLLVRPGLPAGDRAAVLAALVGRCRELAGAWGA